jgi:hypothetical protein
MRLTVRPQEGSELAAGMHTTFDGQVEQQGLPFAQGKGEPRTIMKDFGSAEYTET